MLTVALAAFVVQGVLWVAVAAGVRRGRETAPPPLADAETRAGTDLPISVVVAAHDEEATLPALLDALAAQTHRPFEVVVVDDRSADRTASLAEWRVQDFPVPLRVVRVAEGAPQAAGLPPKKHAVERGVEAAAHGRIALTDADGRPGPDWLAALAHAACGVDDGPRTADPGPSVAGAPEPDAEARPVPGPRSPAYRDSGALLVGYGPYLRAPGVLNRFVRYETVQTAALAAAAVGLGRPWHAVGRNLSYPRALLAEIGGFAHSAGSLSGDDDLLVQHVAATGAAPVRYVWDPAAAVPSPAPPTWRAFWRQKRRHASAGTHYPAAVLAGLGLFHLSNLAVWLAAPVLHLATGVPFGWGLLAGKLLLQRSVFNDVLGALGDEPDLHLWQPLLDGASAVYHQVLAVLGALPTPRRW